jgi:hypothetical protein
MKWKYQLVDTKNEDLQKDLDSFGLHSWELVQIFPVNEVTSTIIGSKPIMRIYLRCVFKKPELDA